MNTLGWAALITLMWAFCFSLGVWAGRNSDPDWRLRTLVPKWLVRGTTRGFARAARTTTEPDIPDGDLERAAKNAWLYGLTQFRHGGKTYMLTYPILDEGSDSDSDSGSR